MTHIEKCLGYFFQSALSSQYVLSEGVDKNSQFYFFYVGVWTQTVSDTKTPVLVVNANAVDTLINAMHFGLSFVEAYRKSNQG